MSECMYWLVEAQQELDNYDFALEADIFSESPDPNVAKAVENNAKVKENIFQKLQKAVKALLEAIKRIIQTATQKVKQIFAKKEIADIKADYEAAVKENPAIASVKIAVLDQKEYQKEIQDAIKKYSAVVNKKGVTQEEVNAAREEFTSTMNKLEGNVPTKEYPMGEAVAKLDSWVGACAGTLGELGKCYNTVRAYAHNTEKNIMDVANYSTMVSYAVISNKDFVSALQRELKEETTWFGRAKKEIRHNLVDIGRVIKGKLTGDRVMANAGKAGLVSSAHKSPILRPGVAIASRKAGLPVTKVEKNLTALSGISPRELRASVTSGAATALTAADGAQAVGKKAVKVARDTGESLVNTGRAAKAVGGAVLNRLSRIGKKK